MKTGEVLTVIAGAVLIASAVCFFTAPDQSNDVPATTTTIIPADHDCNDDGHIWDHVKKGVVPVGDEWDLNPDASTRECLVCDFVEITMVMTVDRRTIQRKGAE